MDPAVVDALRRAVTATPGDPVLRLHLAEVLAADGLLDEALTHVGSVLAADGANRPARHLMARILIGPAAVDDQTIRPGPAEVEPRAGTSDPTPRPAGFDWSEAERELGDSVPPAFVVPGSAPAGHAERADGGFRVERSTVTMADVAGMSEVKKRLDAAFFAPLRNPGLRKLYGKSLRGGLLLYGPPGCGKTFLARAVAGEMGAAFVPVGLADVLDAYVGSSERNIHAVFELARREAPCVVFIDEVDALGQRRSHTRLSALRGAVNQLLTELDGVQSSNDGVFVLAATNQPWDVDPAFKRPGRLDRTLLVLPPDRTARAAIFALHLRDRPVTGIDVDQLARRTDGFSGADIGHVCEAAAEQALLASVAAGEARLITMDDVVDALGQVRPSTGPWLEAVRNVVLFGEHDDAYAELRRYLNKTGRG